MVKTERGLRENRTVPFLPFLPTTRKNKDKLLIPKTEIRIDSPMRPEEIEREIKKICPALEEKSINASESAEKSDQSEQYSEEHTG
jgi:hypothetical protein